MLSCAGCAGENEHQSTMCVFCGADLSLQKDQPSQRQPRVGEATINLGSPISSSPSDIRELRRTESEKRLQDMLETGGGSSPLPARSEESAPLSQESPLPAKMTSLLGKLQNLPTLHALGLLLLGCLLAASLGALVAQVGQ